MGLEPIIEHPVEGWYGSSRACAAGSRTTVPPVLEALGLAEVEHDPCHNRMEPRSLGNRTARHRGSRLVSS